jgi:uncharacterized protein VirK/YbjX
MTNSLTHHLQQTVFFPVRKKFFFYVKTNKFMFAVVKLFIHTKQVLALSTFLATYSPNVIIPFRTYFIAFFSYVSRSLDSQAKLKTVLHNYNFIRKSFNQGALAEIFKTGIVCWSEQISDSDNSVVLSTSKALEFEGSLSLFYKMNGITLYTISFTFVPARCFEVAADTLIFISNSQGVFNQLENISKATKLNRDITPAFILMTVLESLAISLNIPSAIGVGIKNQLSFSANSNYNKFYSNYNEFWEIFAGKKLPSGDYLLSYPLQHKPISSIRQKYRNRTLAKRRRLETISDHCSSNLSLFLKKPH